MEKKDLIKVFDNVFLPQGYKRKGSKWTSFGEIIIKFVELQRSQFSNRYYINYGFIINDLDLKNADSHVFSGLNTKELLDFKNPTHSQEEVKVKLHSLLLDLREQMNRVNTVDDLTKFIETNHLSNMIPQFVKDRLRVNG